MVTKTKKKKYKIPDILKNKTFKLGGDIPPEDEFKAQQKWLYDYTQSKKYRERALTDPTMPSNIQTEEGIKTYQRLINPLGNAVPNYIDAPNSNIIGQYNNETMDLVNKNLGTVTFNNTTLNNKDNPTVSIHELSHMSRLGMADNSFKNNTTNPKYAEMQKIMDNYKSVYTKESTDYVNSPDEIYAKINESRYYLDKEGIRKPTEDYKLEDIKKLKESTNLSIKQLIDGRSDEDILWLMNNLAQNNINNTNTMKVKYGGNLGGWIKDNKQGVLGGIQTAAGIGLMATGVGGPIGASMIAGGIGNMASEYQNDQATKIQNAALNQQYMQQAQLSKLNPTNTIYELGGSLNKSNSITEYNGNKHETGGVPLGENVEVEGGETRGMGVTSDYVFSDTLKQKKSGKTFAELSKIIEKKYKSMENDRIAVRSKNEELARLSREQEIVKEAKFAKEVNKLQQQYPDKFNEMINNQSQQIAPPIDNTQQQLPVDNSQQVVDTNAQLGVAPQDFSQVDTSQMTPEMMTQGMKYGGMMYKNKGKYKMYGGGNYPSIGTNYATGTIGGMTPEQMALWTTKRRDISSQRNGNYSDFAENIIPPTGLANNQSGLPPVNYNIPTLAKANIQQVNNLGNIGVNNEGLISNIKAKGFNASDYTSNGIPTKQQVVAGLQNASGVNNNLNVTPNNNANLSSTGNPDWLGIAASTVPNIIQGAGNAYLGSKLKYDRVNPYQVNPELLDPTRAINNINSTYFNTNNVIKNNATGTGNYMANRLASASLQSGDIANTAQTYDEANAGIKNTAKEYNATNLQNVSGTNAGIQMQELQDKIGLYQSGLSGVASGLNTGVENYFTDKVMRNELAMAGGENFSAEWVPGRFGTQKLVKVFKDMGYYYYNDPVTGKEVYMTQDKKILPDLKAAQDYAATLK